MKDYFFTYTQNSMWIDVYNYTKIYTIVDNLPLINKIYTTYSLYSKYCNYIKNIVTTHAKNNLSTYTPQLLKLQLTYIKRKIIEYGYM